MKRFFLIIILAAGFIACNNSGKSSSTTDSTSINTNTGNVSDGGPNNGAGDTNDYSRMNDMVKDSSVKDSSRK